MSSWRKEPPTYKEWMDAKNHGYWWVKFQIMPAYSEKIRDEIVHWDEAWLTEIVTISVSYEGGLLGGKKPQLHATGTTGLKFDLHDQEKTKGFYWQPVAAPLDDIKDKRPEV